MTELEKAKLALLERETVVKENAHENSKIEFELRKREIAIEENKQNLERRRMWFVGIGVPITLALVSALPTAIIGYQSNQLAISQAQTEIELEAVQAQSRLQLERELAQSRQLEFELGLLNDALSTNLSAEEKANQIIFLVRAGLLNSLNSEELLGMAEATLEDPTNPMLP
ncbi:MAG: hypothetical protein AAGK03_03720 [Pseudomonadota bacterium]